MFHLDSLSFKITLRDTAIFFLRIPTDNTKILSISNG
jgi:hypothetical protein